jgi:hypothetical protein
VALRIDSVRKFPRQHSAKGLTTERLQRSFSLRVFRQNGLRKRALESETMLLRYHY